MPSTTIYKQGDIVLVPFPFTDLSSSKKRPALIVSPDSFNTSKQDVVLIAITSQIDTNRHTVTLEKEDFVDGGLPKPSMIRIPKMFTMHSALIVKRICGISTPKLEQVLKAIREFYS
jgi:mRNA interferase MazF